MELEFRARDYRAEEEACSLPRVAAEAHPLSIPSLSHPQVDVVDHGKDDFFDPLTGTSLETEVHDHGLKHEGSGLALESYSEAIRKEWAPFKKILMQRFPISKKMVSIPSLSGTIMKSGKVNEQSSVDVHKDELDDPQEFPEEDVKLISQQEYVSRLYELKDEIVRAWHANDRITSLNLSIKVARLLTDTSLLQFYPMLFVLASDVMDMLGDLVWDRVRQKAEYTEDGKFICSLPDDFQASDICIDAKETCNNWFCKIASISQLLPRIYLELAVLQCYRFLLDQPVNILNRLALMTRGIADPIASAYCRLYLVHCAHKLPKHDTGYLITCINDMKALLLDCLSLKQSVHRNHFENKRLFVSLIEPTIEYTMKCIFKDANQLHAGDILAGLGLGKSQSQLFGNCSCVSVVLHYLLKELPIEIICSNALDVLDLVKCSNDFSLDQYLNFRLLGFRLNEKISQVHSVDEVVNKALQVASGCNSIEKLLKIIEAYVDIVLEKEMDGYIYMILESIFERACNEEISENGMESLQSVILKLLNHFDNLEIIISLKHFMDILDLVHGSSRNIINMHILGIATRSGRIHDHRIIQLLFEISKSLHDALDISSIRNKENQQAALRVSRFVNMVDYGPEMECHLTFLVECRETFGSMNRIEETLVHSSNLLAIKAIRNGSNFNNNFVKSCLAFSEVTIPSVPAQLDQLNLYLEAAEVALHAGLVSHSDGLLDSAICCLRNVILVDGLRVPSGTHGILSALCRLCSLNIMVPGNLGKGVTYIPKNILDLFNSQMVSPWMKVKVICALIISSAALCQETLPYNIISRKVPGNDLVFFSDQSYLKDFLSFSSSLLHDMVNTVLQEPSLTDRGNLALEACNCILSSFKTSHDVLAICSKLVETAKLCLTSDNKYLQSTMKLLNTHQTYSEAGS